MENAKILTAGVQNNRIVLWAEINGEDREEVHRDFQVVWTGTPYGFEGTYIDTLTVREDYVLHIFEVPFDSFEVEKEEDDFDFYRY